MSKRIVMILLVVPSSLLTYCLDYFSNLALMLFVPGLLLGLSVSIPNMKKSNELKNVFIETILILLVWLLTILVYFPIQMITEDFRITLVFTGLMSGALIVYVYSNRFSLKNKRMSFFVVPFLSVMGILLGHYLVQMMPRDRLLNFGKGVFMWMFLVGLGLALMTKFEGIENNPPRSA